MISPFIDGLLQYGSSRPLRNERHSLRASSMIVDQKLYVLGKALQSFFGNILMEMESEVQEVKIYVL